MDIFCGSTKNQWRKGGVRGARFLKGHDEIIFGGLKVEIHLMDRPDQKPLGGGETSSGPAAAAIANAVNSALGHPIRDLPLTPERIKAAIK